MLVPPQDFLIVNHELPFGYWCAIPNTRRLIALSTYQSLQTELVLGLLKSIFVNYLSRHIPSYAVWYIHSVTFICTSSPFYQHGLTFIPAFINNYFHYKVWDNFRGCIVEVRGCNPSPYWVCDFLSMLRLKLNRVSKKEPQVWERHLYLLNMNVIWIGKQCFCNDVNQRTLAKNITEIMFYTCAKYTHIELINL